MKFKAVIRYNLATLSIIIAFSVVYVLSAVLVAIWFQEGMIMGGGDIGLPFYRPTRIFEIVRYVWWGDVAPGIAFSRSINTIPFYFTLSVLSSIGLPDFAIQALIFFFVLVVSGTSVYFLTLAFVEDRTRQTAGILAALFYMLNPFSLVLVWHRFDPSSILFSALLPLGLLLTVRALRGKKIFLPAFTIALLTVAFSYCFSSPAYVLTFWIVLLSYPVFRIIYSRGANFLHTAKFVISSLGLFLLLNSWWILPFYYEYLIPSVISSYGWAGGQTLGSYGLFDVSRLFDRYYLAMAPIGDVPYEHGHFGLIYTTPLFQLISFMIPIIAFSTFLFKHRDQSVLYFALLSVLGIFLAKGAAPPLGEPMQWLVGNFLIFGPLRTAFGKLGFIVALGYSFLFGVGIASLYAWVKGHRWTLGFKGSFRKALSLALIGIVCFSFFGLYQWPMWTGDVFRRGDGIPDYRVRVPSYYDEAREWLSTQPEGRIIAMPFGGILTYTWSPYGYHGVESGEWFFNRPVLGEWISVSHLDEIVFQWRKLYHTNQMWKFMNLFGARFVMVRHDIQYPDPSEHRIDNPADIEFTMKNFLKLVTRDLALNCDKFSVVWGFKSEISPGENGTLILEDVIGGDNKQFGVSYSVPQELRDWSNIPYLEIRLNSNTEGNLLFAVLDNVGHGINWDGRYDIAYKISSSDVGKWKTFMLDMNQPTSGYLNKSAVTQIIIAILNFPSSHVKLEISNLAIATDLEFIPNPHISHVKSIGELDFYKIDDVYFLDKIYATNKIAFLSNAYTMLEMMNEPSFIPGDTLVYLDSQCNMSDYNFLKSLNNDVPLYKPSLSFRQIDPTHYEVTIVNATQPFFLFFGETYHPLWKASIQGTGEIPDNRHFIMNGYGNAWYIDKTGTYKIEIKFSLQTVFNYCAIASVFILFLCLLYSTPKLVKNRIKTGKKSTPSLVET